MAKTDVVHQATGKIIAGLLVVVMLWSVFGGVLSAEIEVLQKTGTEAATTEVPYVDITAADAKAMLQNEQKVILLDVRTPAEFSSGYIRGARCVPLSELKARISTLDRSNGIVVYSNSGVRSVEGWKREDKKKREQRR